MEPDINLPFFPIACMVQDIFLILVVFCAVIVARAFTAGVDEASKDVRLARARQFWWHINFSWSLMVQGFIVVVPHLLSNIDEVWSGREPLWFDQIAMRACWFDDVTIGVVVSEGFLFFFTWPAGRCPQFIYQPNPKFTHVWCLVGVNFGHWMKVVVEVIP